MLRLFNVFTLLIIKIITSKPFNLMSNVTFKKLREKHFILQGQGNLESGVMYCAS